MEVAAYYFPNFHVDPRNETWHGPGWTEWELLKRAEPRFPGHLPPPTPLWGYEDEADPAVMARKIAAASSHGLTAFIFDWYWYDGRPFLERALEHGFMTASNRSLLQFALMWANHDWLNIHPWKRSTGSTPLESGAADAEAFETATDYVIERYFNHPSYLTIDGCPYFSIYDLTTLVAGLGGLEPTAEALCGLRRRARAAGFPGIHLNIIAWEHPILPGAVAPVDFDTALDRLGFDSVTSYVWIHHHRLPSLLTPYTELACEAEKGWYAFAERFPVPYFPNVTVGWDPTPRTVSSDGYDPALGYPHTNIVTNNDPEAFGAALERACRFVDGTTTGPRLITINAWNEWTEGSYLEPDTIHGLGYLEQITRVLGTGPNRAGRSGTNHSRRRG